MRSANTRTTLYAVDELGEVVAHAVYDVWGSPLTETYTDTNFSGAESLLSYATYSWDETLELWYAQARMYDAELGRFVSEDPARDGGNWYVYAGGNPGIFIDPSGKWAENDGSRSREAQIQLFALTYAYYKASANSTKEKVQKKAEEVRRNYPANSSEGALPFASILDAMVVSNTKITKSTLDTIAKHYRMKLDITPLLFEQYRIHIGLTNENLVNIPGIDADGKDKIFSGGDQDWLETKFQNGTGCGSISLTNLLFYYYNKLECGNTKKSITQEEHLEEYYKHFGGLWHYLSLIATAGAYEDIASEILNTERGYGLKSTRATSSSTSAAKAMGMIAGALLTDNPVALQNWGNANSSVTAWHWVTITAADLNVFNLKESMITYSSWGALYDPGYKFSDAWRGGASVVFFSAR